jgi:drug/metabolite transporter (DMT)-like permease
MNTKSIAVATGMAVAKRGGPGIRFLFTIIFLHQIISSLAYPVAKLGLNQIDPFLYAFLRFTICAVIYSIILGFAKKSVRISTRDRFRIILVGILLIPMNQLIFLIGQSKTTAGHGALIFATTPLFIFILAVLFLGERLSFRKAAGIVVALSGVYIIMAGGKIRFGTENLYGDWLLVVSVMSWASGTILGIPLARKYGALRATGLALVYGAMVYFPFGLYRALNSDLGHFPWQVWFSILYMAIVISVLAYFLWYWVLKYMEASRVAIVQNIQPIIASGVAAAVLAEPITRYLIIGGVVVIGGVLLTEIK